MATFLPTSVLPMKEHIEQMSGALAPPCSPGSYMISVLDFDRSGQRFEMSTIPTQSLPLLRLQNKDQYCILNGCLFGKKTTIWFYSELHRILTFGLNDKKSSLIMHKKIVFFYTKNCALWDITFEIGSGFPPAWSSRSTRLPDHPLIFSHAIFALVWWMNWPGFDKTSRGWLD